MNIWVAINKDGGWLRRHNPLRHITDTDWWLNPRTLFFRKASAGDLFFVTRGHPNYELFTCARLTRDYREEPPETAWQYTSEAYSMDSTYRKRAAGILEEQVTRKSKIGLIALQDLIWFPAEQRPSLDGIKGSTVHGRKYTASHPEYEYLFDLFAQYPKTTAGSDAIRNAYIRATPAQCAKILLLHKEMASRFAKWLRNRKYRDVQGEKEWVDVRFTRDNHSFMAELKICYGLNTRKAIREAIGQVIEYNHYPGRTAAEEWWIILDQQPTPDDAAYIRQLREQHLMPLYLGHETTPETGEVVVLKP